MYIFKRTNLDGSTWKSKSMNTNNLFYEETYLNKTLPAGEVVIYRVTPRN